MSRVITSISLDLKFNTTVTPPAITVEFTDVAANGLEAHGTTTITDALSATAWAAFGERMLTAARVAIGAKELDVSEPGAVAARITAADTAQKQRQVAEAACVALTTETVRLNGEIAAKRLEVAALLAALVPAPVAP